MKPYAVYLLERFRSRFRAGESVSQLAATEGIPLDRIQIRLDAAILLERMRQSQTEAYAVRRAAQSYRAAEPYARCSAAQRCPPHLPAAADLC